MATITFNLKELKSASGVEEVAEIVDRLGMSVEEIKGDDITIDVTPNRPDLLDMHSMAKAISNFSGRSVPREMAYRIETKPINQIEIGLGVSARPYIAAVAAKNLDLKGRNLTYLLNFLEKLSDTYGRKRRKIAIGINDMRRIKGSLKYEGMAEGKFKPIGSSKQISFKQIFAEHPKGQQYGAILKGAKKYPVLKDSEKIVALIPIINSEESRITEATTDVIIDVTGNSQNAVDQMANVIACTLIDRGAEVYTVNIKKNGKSTVTPSLEYTDLTLKLTKIDRTLGNLLTESDLVTLANRMGYSGSKYGDSILVSVPPYRVDFMNEQDAIEDIVIAYGYDNVKPLPVIGTSLGVSSEINDLSDSLATLMLGLGFTESYNNYLTNERVCFENMQKKPNADSVVSVTYSKSEMFTMLRDSLLPGLMSNLGKSAHEKMPQRLFEVGNSFIVRNGRVVESLRISFVSEHSKANFAEAKAVAQAIFRKLGITVAIAESADSSYIKGRCATGKAAKDSIATFGEIHPAVLVAFRLEEPVAAGEIEIIREIPYSK